jgi:hypothetical protein
VKFLEDCKAVISGCNLPDTFSTVFICDPANTVFDAIITLVSIPNSELRATKCKTHSLLTSQQKQDLPFSENRSLPS